MLVLKRYVGEGIQIGPDIRIVITDAGPGNCPGHGWAKVGIEAPRDVAISRDNAKNQDRREYGK